MIEDYTIKQYNFSQSNASGVFTLEIKDFYLIKGEIVFLMGGSGSGKSTFFNLITGIRNSELSEDIRKYFANIDFVMHDSKLLPWHTLRKNVHVINKLNHNQINEDHLIAMCYKLGLSSQILQLKTWQLSLGMRQRFEIALALTMKPELVIFDEALSGIDNTNKKNVCKVIHDYVKKSGVTVIGTAHQVSDILRLADRVVIIENGILSKSISLTTPISDRLKMAVNELYLLPDAELLLNVGI